MLGLDAAGKTTILYKLHIGEVLSTVPTIGKIRCEHMQQLLLAVAPMVGAFREHVSWCIELLYSLHQA